MRERTMRPSEEMDIRESCRLRSCQCPHASVAICDIFEALTASDRPYKKAKSLSVAVDILAGFRDRGHIDSDLFELF